MFQLTEEDIAVLKSQITLSNVQTSLRSQIVTLNKGQGQHLKYMPYAFTEQGVAMLSAVLRSSTAIDVSIRIMDAFVAMRSFIVSNTLVVTTSAAFHDRFIIIDQSLLLHVGASLNHIGKKCFAISVLDAANIPSIMQRI